MADGRPPELFDTGLLSRRVAELAAEIDSDSDRPFLLVGILTGAYMFAADLSRALSTPHDVAFVGARSYGDDVTPSAEVAVRGLDTIDVADKDVLIVEDILDTGNTLHTLQGGLRDAGAASVRTCVLLWKDIPRRHDVETDYVGFAVPDVWVVGYGIDCRGEWRHLPYVGYVEVRDDESA